MKWPKSRYVKYLEGEVERLRTENRDFMNALLLKEGLPALGPREVKSQVKSTTGKMLPSQFIGKMARFARGNSGKDNN
jgi:hypothetical protein